MEKQGISVLSGKGSEGIDLGIRISAGVQNMRLSPSEISKLPEEKRTAVLSILFEPCDELVKFVEPVFDGLECDADWPQAIEQIRGVLHTLEPCDPHSSKIVAAHPRLGAQKVDSQHSRLEQSSLAGEASALQEWNTKYEQTFPGLRYVVFVAGRSRQEILADMQLRIAENNYQKEVFRAFDAMCDIALDRQKKLANL